MKTLKESEEADLRCTGQFVQYESKKYGIVHGSNLHNIWTTEKIRWESSYILNWIENCNKILSVNLVFVNRVIACKCIFVYLSVYAIIHTSAPHINNYFSRSPIMFRNGENLVLLSGFFHKSLMYYFLEFQQNIQHCNHA